MRKNVGIVGLAAVVMGLAIFGGAGMAADPVTSSSSELKGRTVPSDERTISFVRPGRIVELLVKEGDEVKAGQVLAKQDDREEKAKVAVDNLNAKDETEIELDKELQKEDQISYERMIKSGGGAGEIDDAKQKVVVDAARIIVATMKKMEAALSLEGSQAALDKLTVKVPEDMGGIVQELYLRNGESADSGNMKLVRIVQLDPMRVEVQVPISQAKGLKVGDPAVVTFQDKTEKAAKVTYKAAAGSSATQTLLVRVEMPNPSKDPSGENVVVKFTGAAGVARKNDE